MSEKSFLSNVALKDKSGKILRLKLEDGSITTEKIADYAVTTGKIKDGSITTEKLAKDIFIPSSSPSFNLSIDITDSLKPLDMGLNADMDSYDNIDVYNTIQEGCYQVIDNSNKEDGNKDVVTGIMMVFKDYANSNLTQVLSSNYDIGEFTDSSTTAYTLQYRFWVNNEWSTWKSYSSNTGSNTGGGSTNIDLSAYLTKAEAGQTYHQLIQQFKVDKWQDGSSPTGIQLTLVTDSWGHGQQANIPYAGYPNNNIEGGVISTADYNRFNNALQFNTLTTTDANSATVSGIYPNITTNGAVEGETFLVQTLRSTMANSKYYITQFAYGTSSNVAGKVYTRYITYSNSTFTRSAWILLGSGSGNIEPSGYTITYVTNGHGTTPAKVTNATKLPATLPTLTASGYTFGGWYTNSGLTTKAVAGSTISSDVTLYAKWTAIPTGYTITYNNMGHGSTPSKVSNATKLPSTLPTLSATGYTFGGWYTDSGLTTKAVAGSTISSNITLYAKWTAIPALNMYTGNTADIPTESEILVGTKYDYNTVKTFLTPQMVAKCIWVCLPNNVTLVSMENRNFKGDYLFNIDSGTNKLTTQSLTLNGTQYTLYYLKSLPTKNPYDTIVK